MQSRFCVYPQHLLQRLFCKTLKKQLYLLTLEYIIYRYIVQKYGGYVKCWRKIWENILEQMAFEGKPMLY